jgi:hypothetical protein
VAQPSPRCDGHEFSHRKANAGGGCVNFDNSRTLILTDMLTSAVNLIINLINSQTEREAELDGLKSKCHGLEAELEAMRHKIDSLMPPMNGSLPSHLFPPCEVDTMPKVGYGQWQSSGRRDGMQEQVGYTYGASSSSPSYVNAKGSRPFMYQ